MEQVFIMDGKAVSKKEMFEGTSWSLCVREDFVSTPKSMLMVMGPTKTDRDGSHIHRRPGGSEDPSKSGQSSQPGLRQVGIRP
jgi:hypothetical protein